jgi:hypothetical protein
MRVRVPARVPGLAAIGLFLAAASAAEAQTFGDRLCYGYFYTDRWGHDVLHAGPYYLTVTPNAAAALRKHAGKPLEVEIARIISLPDKRLAIDGLKGVKAVEPAPPLTLTLAIVSVSRTLAQGEGVTLRMTVRNDAGKPVDVRHGSLALVVVTDSPFENEAIGYRDAEGAAYWYYRNQDVACRRVLVPLRADKVLSPKAVGTRAKPQASGKTGAAAPGGAAGDRLALRLNPGESYEDTLVIGQELLPDEYEVFLCIAAGNHTFLPGPMSERLGFEVSPVKPGGTEARPQ